MPLITVLTTTYNRAHLLPRLYDSLCGQTFKDFEWIVVDDGSTDDTEGLFNSKFRIQNSKLEARQSTIQNSKLEARQSTIQNSKFPVRYFKIENRGKHGAVNYGVKYAKGELVFIADSDDMLLHYSLQIVAEEYNKVKNDGKIGGIAGLDINMVDGKVIGSGLPKESIDCNAMDIRYQYHVTGDLKEVFRTTVLREYPFPEVAGELFCPEQLDWFRIAQKYNLHYVNRPIYIAEYQNDGITAGITRARMHSPIATMMTYAEMLRYDIPFSEKLKAAINYWRFRCCYHKTQENRRFAIPKVGLLWSLLAPFGILLHLNDMRIVGKKI